MQISKWLKFILFIMRVVLIALPIFLLSWLVYKDLVVSGELTAVYDFKNLSPFITVLRPQSRLSEPKQVDRIWFQQVKKQPVYFDVRLPRHFDIAKVKLIYQNLDQSIVELGALVDKDRWLFDLKPVENRIVNFLFSDKFHWSYISEGKTVLFQKNPRFKTIKDFLTNLPPREKIATYNYQLDYPFRILGYSPKPGGITISKSLRGSHRIYTYVKNEPLDFSFWFQDVNRHFGDDYVSLDVYYQDDLIYSQFIKDDGNTSDNLKMSEVEEVRINLPDLAEGAYRIEITTASDDIFIRKIVTAQDYLVFVNQVYLADEVGFVDENSLERSSPTFLWSNGHLITAATTHLEGLQEIAIGNQMLKVSATHQNFELETPFGLKSVVVPRGDVRLSTKGLFSFSKASFFEPVLTSLADGLDFDREQIDYVIADYQLPESRLDGWQAAIVEFEVDKYYLDDNKLHFVISLPYLEKGQAGVRIAEIGVELRGRPLRWQEVINKIKTILIRD